MEPPDRNTLLELYKIAVDEYRFSVRLNWDRTREYLVLNIAILTVATGLLKIEGPGAANWFVMLIFAIGALTSFVGTRAIQRGHQYFRRAVYKKTLLEDRLGLLDAIDGHSHALATLSIGTTTGMSRSAEILNNTESWLKRPLEKGDILFAVSVLLWAMAIIDVGGGVYAWTRTSQAGNGATVGERIMTAPASGPLPGPGDITISPTPQGGFSRQRVQVDGTSRGLGGSAGLPSAISTACQEIGPGRIWLYSDDGSHSRVDCQKSN